ncbi:hypothetical protein [Streptomyces capitiformicae]|uniref:Uncharacterized protein n=1 Tax=Streptomyces capitiformicae TaxID=2014920 RepID=A0A919DPD3_9ACTN|nr:hypothetical protein GCM10017771_92630 [Streptomyces capitiformicae]
MVALVADYLRLYYEEIEQTVQRVAENVAAAHLTFTPEGLGLIVSLCRTARPATTTPRR